MTDSATPIIFSSVESVLASWRSDWASSTSFGALDPVCVRMLSRFCERSRANVVLMSSWSSELRTSAEWKVMLLEVCGATLPITHVVHGLDIRNAKNRWDDIVDEILSIEMNVRHAILGNGEFFRPREDLVAVDPAVGLTMANLFSAGKILGVDAKLLEELG